VQCAGHENLKFAQNLQIRRRSLVSARARIEPGPRAGSNSRKSTKTLLFFANFTSKLLYIYILTC
jgi:hypothetical protein